jgi:hypothetical protein
MSGSIQNICNALNQVYDPQFNTCVSCSDPTTQPSRFRLSGAPDLPGPSNSINNPIYEYKCLNRPITTYKPVTLEILSHTCGNGEQITYINNPNDPRCVITFTAQQK